MSRYIFDVLPQKCTGTFLTYQNGENVQYIFGGPPPLRGGDVLYVVKNLGTLVRLKKRQRHTKKFMVITILQVGIEVVLIAFAKHEKI